MSAMRAANLSSPLRHKNTAWLPACTDKACQRRADDRPSRIHLQSCVRTLCWLATRCQSFTIHNTTGADKCATGCRSHPPLPPPPIPPTAANAMPTRCQHGTNTVPTRQLQNTHLEHAGWGYEHLVGIGTLVQHGANTEPKRNRDPKLGARGVGGR